MSLCLLHLSVKFRKIFRILFFYNHSCCIKVNSIVSMTILAIIGFNKIISFLRKNYVRFIQSFLYLFSCGYCSPLILFLLFYKESSVMYHSKDIISLILPCPVQSCKFTIIGILL